MRLFQTGAVKLACSVGGTVSKHLLYEYARTEPRKGIAHTEAWWRRSGDLSPRADRDNEMKDIKDLLKADPRQGYIVRVDRLTGLSRPRTIEDHYAGAADIKLNPIVPVPVQTVFDRALHVYVYSWFQYDLAPVAELQGFSALELALKIRVTEAKREIKYLSNLLRFAQSQGWIRGEGFPRLLARRRAPRFRDQETADGPYTEEEYVACCKAFVEFAPDRRNTLAHGTTYTDLPWVSLGVLENISDAINQLFTESPAV